MPSARTIRRVAIVAGSLAGVLILIVLALPYVVSLDSIRARVIARAESSLHRRVEIGAMRLQIVSGLGAGIEKITVYNNPGFDSPALVSADRVSIKVAFWPLLSKRLEVRRLVLDGVTVTVERSPTGALNIDDFLSAGQRDSGPATQTAAAALLVSRLEINRGRATFVDRKVAPGQTVTLGLDDLTGRLTDIGPSAAARFDLSARFLADTGRNLTLRGTLGPLPAEGPVGDAPLDAQFSAKGLALARLAPYVAAFQGADPGALSLDGRAAGKALGAVALSGKVALAPAGGSSGMPAVDGTFAVTLDWPKGTLAVGRSLFDVANLPLAVEGRVDDLHQTPRVDLHVTTPGDVGLDAVTGLPGIAGRLPDGVRLAGRARLDLQIRGPASDLDVHGATDAAPFGVSLDGKPMLAAASVHATLESRGKAPLSGRVTSPSGKLKDVPFENLRADWTWDAGALTLSPSAAVFGGTIGGRIESDFAHPKTDSRMAFEVKGVHAQPLVESVTTLRNLLAGTLNGKVALSSRGLGRDAISKTGRGGGHIALTDADVKTAQLMPEVARSLSAVGGVAGFQVPASLEDTRFSTLETSLELANGRVATPDLVLTGRDVSVSASGSLGLDKTLAYQGRIVLGPAVVKSLGNAGRSIADSSGRVALPFHATGALNAPKVTIDESVVVDLARHVLARKAQEKLGGAAGKALGDALDGGDGKANPLDVLQQFLKAPLPTPTPAPR
jgi:AsmA protein